MLQHLIERCVRLSARLRKCDNARPAVHGARRLAALLVELGATNIRHEVALIDRQRLIEARGFPCVVARKALCRSEVHPQIGSGCIGRDCLFE